jgi:hypothetical protein
MGDDSQGGQDGNGGGDIEGGFHKQAFSIQLSAVSFQHSLTDG